MVASPTTTHSRHAGTAVHPRLERGAGLFRTGYPYFLQLRSRWQATTAEIRLFGRRTTILSGPEGIQLFYNEAIMRRRDALPRPLLRTLFGAGAVHGLDDDEHRQRKAMFVGLLTPSAARDIATIADDVWRAPGHTCSLDPAGVFDEAVGVHCEAVCRWAGIPSRAVDSRLGRYLAAIVDGFGSLGPRWL